MSEASFEGTPLRIEGVSFYCPARGSQFKGRHWMMDMNVVDKLIENDPTALQSISGGIGEAFARSASDK